MNIREWLVGLLSKSLTKRELSLIEQAGEDDAIAGATAYAVGARRGLQKVFGELNSEFRDIVEIDEVPPTVRKIPSKVVTKGRVR